MAHKTIEQLSLEELSILPPPAPIIAELPEPEEKEPIETPKYRNSVSRVSLAQLALALSPGMGDGFGGDFSMNFEVEAIDYAETVFEIGEVDRIPRPIYRVAPSYPYKLKQSGIGGTAWLYFVCDTRGRVRDIRAKSSTHLKFEEQATRALRNWRFEPGIKDGKEVNVKMLVPFVFRVRTKQW